MEGHFTCKSTYMLKLGQFWLYWCLKEPIHDWKTRIWRTPSNCLATAKHFGTLLRNCIATPWQPLKPLLCRIQDFNNQIPFRNIKTSLFIKSACLTTFNCDCVCVWCTADLLERGGTDSTHAEDDCNSVRENRWAGFSCHTEGHNIPADGWWTHTIPDRRAAVIMAHSFDISSIVPLLLPSHYYPLLSYAKPHFIPIECNKTNSIIY